MIDHDWTQLEDVLTPEELNKLRGWDITQQEYNYAVMVCDALESTPDISEETEALTVQLAADQSTQIRAADQSAMRHYHVRDAYTLVCEAITFGHSTDIFSTARNQLFGPAGPPAAPAGNHQFPAFTSDRWRAHAEALNVPYDELIEPEYNRSSLHIFNQIIDSKQDVSIRLADSLLEMNRLVHDHQEMVDSVEDHSFMGMRSSKSRKERKQVAEQAWKNTWQAKTYAEVASCAYAQMRQRRAVTHMDCKVEAAAQILRYEVELKVMLDFCSSVESECRRGVYMPDKYWEHEIPWFTTIRDVYLRAIFGYAAVLQGDLAAGIVGRVLAPVPGLRILTPNTFETVDELALAVG